MNLQQVREKYRTLRSQAPQNSNKRLAYDNVLTCLENTQDAAEAAEYLQSEINEATEWGRFHIYEDALNDLREKTEGEAK